MALGSVLVDRGRTEGPNPSDEPEVRVEGRKKRTPNWGPWFRCRLTIQQGTEIDQQGRRQQQTRPTLLSKVKIDAKQNIEIISKEVHGNTTAVAYQIDGAPQPLRRRRSVIGWKSNLLKVS